jgi:hypothetical protein
LPEPIPEPESKMAIGNGWVRRLADSILSKIKEKIRKKDAEFTESSFVEDYSGIEKAKYP